MATARSIFTLDERGQLFWVALDMPVTVAPLKVALGFLKNYFWAFQKNNQKTQLTYTCIIIFLKCPKINFFPILKQLLMVPLPRSDQKMPKQLNPPI